MKDPGYPSNHSNVVPNRILSSIFQKLQAALLKGDGCILLLGCRPTRKKLVLAQFSHFPDKLNHFLGIVVTTKQLLVRWLRGNSATTVRDLYYQDVDAFQKSQINCNRYLQQIIVKSWMQSFEDYGIHPSQKGLIFGNCQVEISGFNLNLDFGLEPILIPILQNTYENKSTHEETREEDKNLITEGLNGVKPEYSNAKTLLKRVQLPESLNKQERLDPTRLQGKTSKAPLRIIILEKEAIFQSFCRFLAQTNTTCQIIVVTGKGFPDRLTLRFVAYLSRHFATLISAFVDSDVFGISICKQYRFGNNVQCLTGHSVDINYSGVFILDYAHGWLNISRREYTFSMNMLLQIEKLRSVHENRASRYELYKWHRELTRGLILYKKSEMNVLESSKLNQYILKKLSLHHNT